MNRHLYILGAGGLAKELGAYIKYANSEYMLSGFFDDNKTGSIDNLAPIKGPISKINVLKSGDNIMLGVGLPELKNQIFSQIKNPDQFHFPYFIQPNVSITDRKSLDLGRGSIICSGSSLTTTIRIGDFALLNLNCTIGHDVHIGDFSSVMPGANISGKVTIGREVLIGAGATILQGINIGDGATVGAGAVVTKDVKPGMTVIGIPARER